MSKSPLTTQEQFFYDHAGYSIAPGESKRQGRIRSAKSLAEAETYASEHDWGFCWEEDPEGCIGCDCGSKECACASKRPHECLYCVVRDLDGNALASLGSICEPGVNYSRVVEAELASEAMHN